MKSPAGEIARKAAHAAVGLIVLTAVIVVAGMTDAGTRTCEGRPYDRSEWRYDARKMRMRLWLANPRSAYTGVVYDEFPDGEAAEVEHLVSIKEAHDRGGCRWSKRRKRAFASDIRNVVLAAPKVNHQKGASAEWRPQAVPAWFEARRNEILEREGLK